MASNADKTARAYDTLVERGESLVKTVRRSPATKQATQATRIAVSRTKAASSRVRSSAKTTRSTTEGATTTRPLFSKHPGGGGHASQLHAPRPDPRRHPQRKRLRGLPEDRRHLGPPARMPLMRPRRLLRQLPEPPRHQTLPRHPAPHRPVLPARRGLALVLRGPADAGAGLTGLPG